MRCYIVFSLVYFFDNASITAATVTGWKSNENQESDFKDAASVCLPLITAAIRDIEKDVFPKFCSLNVEIPTSPLAEMLLLLFCNEQSSRLGNGHQFLVYPKGRGVALRLTTQRKSIEVVESVGVAGKSDPKQTAKYFRLEMAFCFKMVWTLDYMLITLQLLAVPRQCSLQTIIISNHACEL
nr:5'-nucleotidase surE [Ipomoea batatas]GMD23272.1 5'-nucleotidase surE [Ipomoea batatas]